VKVVTRQRNVFPLAKVKDGRITTPARSAIDAPFQRIRDELFDVDRSKLQKRLGWLSSA
jgi:hypothetical protein